MGSFDQNRSMVISGHPTGVSRTASNLDQSRQELNLSGQFTGGKRSALSSKAAGKGLSVSGIALLA
jgi:hypothetical protein